MTQPEGQQGQQGRRLFTLEDLRQNSSDKSCYLLIHGKVYNVTDFLEEHPGGYDIILGSTGKDATQDFEEIGHSNSAKELLSKYYVGDYEGGDSAPAPPPSSKPAASSSPVSTSTRMFNVVLPVAILAAAVGLNWYLAKSSSS